MAGPQVQSHRPRLVQLESSLGMGDVRTLVWTASIVGLVMVLLGSPESPLNPLADTAWKKRFPCWTRSARNRIIVIGHWIAG